MASSTILSLQARYLFPVDRPPIRDGCITIADGILVSIGNKPNSEPRDLGDVAILPALINAHTHLEFSGLDEPLGERGMAFTDWIREVLRWRRSEMEHEEECDFRSEAIRRGIKESIVGGSTVLGEISTLPWEGSTQHYDGMHGVTFLELIGLANDRHDELMAAANASIKASQHSTPSARPGLSPHAPYTVSPRLVESIAALSKQTRVPVAMHLAETREELELLRSGTGPFKELLEELGGWQDDVIQANSTPLDYLRQLAEAERSLVVHGNYLSNEEVDFLGQHQHRMSAIYCPRTHAYFEHEPYPLGEMLERDVNVALGTDSRASNPDLSLLNEMRFVAERHTDVSPEAILRLVTENAAKALGVQKRLGTLTPGKQADFIVIPIARNTRSDPYELLLDPSQKVQQAWRNGVPVYSDGHLLG